MTGDQSGNGSVPGAAIGAARTATATDSGAEGARELFRRLSERPADLLRFATAGSVDDGKSTLIGRLLYDSKQVLTDQLEHVEQTSQRMGHDFLDLSLLTDGLRAEREQGITIDVAYRYFATAQRRFIIADTPGHEQYTRNMVTGASTADLAIVLVDARKGVIAQSKRHAFISSLLAIPHVVVCVNKMDLVEYDEAVFDGIVEEFDDFAARLEMPDLTFIPISALHRRQRRRSLREDALVRRPAAALPPRARAHRLRPQPDRRALPRAMGDPPAGLERGRLPRLRRSGRRRRDACGRRGRRAARRAALDDRRHRHLRRSRVGGVPADVRGRAPGRRHRRRARLDDRAPAEPADRREPLRGAALLDVRAPAGEAPPLHRQANDAHGDRRRHRRALPDRRRDAAPRRAAPRRSSSTTSVACRWS